MFVKHGGNRASVVECGGKPGRDTAVVWRTAFSGLITFFLRSTGGAGQVFDCALSHSRSLYRSVYEGQDGAAFVIAESETIRNHNIMTDIQSKPPLRWFERNWVGFVGSFLFCVAAAGISMFLRFTLADSLSQRIEAGIFSGFLFGGLMFVLFIGPVQLVVVFLLQWLKIQPRWGVLWSLIPAGMVFIYLIRSSQIAVSPSGEQKWFEQAVGVPIPPDVKLVHAEHGLGLQDRRGLWLLEGEPAAFDRLVAARGWWPQEQEVPGSGKEGIRRAANHFGTSALWTADAIYIWAADKEATNPFGMSYLLADKERKRWAVWVVD